MIWLFGILISSFLYYIIISLKTCKELFLSVNYFSYVVSPLKYKKSRNHQGSQDFSTTIFNYLTSELLFQNQDSLVA